MGLLGFLMGGHAAGKDLKAGDPAPMVGGVDQDGREVDLGTLYAQGTVLVYFYPKADTPGCTAQACSLRDEYQKLTEKGVIVVGVSRDSVKAQKAFQVKHRLPFTLVADTEGRFTEAFGVPTLLGLPARQAFLIKKGKIVWIDRKASTRQQAADVLETLEK